MALEDELRAELLSVFEHAEYPLQDPTELLPALPDGVATTFEAGDFSMSVIELNIELDSDFPYDSAAEMADHIIEELQDNGFI